METKSLVQVCPNQTSDTTWEENSLATVQRLLVECDKWFHLFVVFHFLFSLFLFFFFDVDIFSTIFQQYCLNILDI